MLVPASMVIPFADISVPPAPIRIWIGVASTMLALFLTVFISSNLGRAAKQISIVRDVLVGMLTMRIAYIEGHIFSAATG